VVGGLPDLRPGLRRFAVVVWERSTWSARSTPVFGRARTNDVDRDEPPPAALAARAVRQGVGVNVPGRVDRRNRHSEVRGLVTGKSAIRRSGPALAASVTEAAHRLDKDLDGDLFLRRRVSRHVHDGSGRPADPRLDHQLEF
jgi:hypothetical protein